MLIPNPQCFSYYAEGQSGYGFKGKRAFDHENYCSAFEDFRPSHQYLTQMCFRLSALYGASVESSTFDSSVLTPGPLFEELPSCLFLGYTRSAWDRVTPVE